MAPDATEPERPDLSEALRAIVRDHPAWHTWTGVGGLLYARRLMSSPPVVFRTTDPGELETRIREHEGKQR